MNLEDIKSYLKSGRYNKLEERVEMLHTMGVVVHIEQIGKRVTRLRYKTDRLIVFNFGTTERTVRMPDDGRPFGKEHRRSFR